MWAKISFKQLDTSYTSHSHNVYIYRIGLRCVFAAFASWNVTPLPGFHVLIRPFALCNLLDRHSYDFVLQRPCTLLH